MNAKLVRNQIVPHCIHMWLLFDTHTLQYCQFYGYWALPQGLCISNHCTSMIVTVPTHSNGRLFHTHLSKWHVVVSCWNSESVSIKIKMHIKGWTQQTISHKTGIYILRDIALTFWPWVFKTAWNHLLSADQSANGIRLKKEDYSMMFDVQCWQHNTTDC